MYRNFRGHQYKSSIFYAASRCNTWFIPYNTADPANFVDVIDGAHEVFTPDIINAVGDDDYKEEEEEEEWSELTSPSSEPSRIPVNALSNMGSNYDH